MRRHIAALDRAVAQLRKHAGKPSSVLSEDLDEAWTVQHRLQVCAQYVLDVSTHVTASAGIDAPDYATSIDRLADLGVLPREFAAKLRGIAGFRNVLVQAYLEVDLEQVHAAVNQRLDDFVAFARHVDAYLAAAGE